MNIVGLFSRASPDLRSKPENERSGGFSNIPSTRSSKQLTQRSSFERSNIRSIRVNQRPLSRKRDARGYVASRSFVSEIRRGRTRCGVPPRKVADYLLDFPSLFSRGAETPASFSCDGEEIFLEGKDGGVERRRWHGEPRREGPCRKVGFLNVSSMDP